MPDPIVTSSVRERVELLMGRRRDNWVLAAVVGIVAVGALILWLRGAPARVAPPATYPRSDPLATPAVASGTPSEVAVVHVAGAVRRPGLYELPPEARVADAIEAAGGPRRRADVDLLNLAEPVVDGQKIEVLSAEEAPSLPATAPATPGAVATTPGALVNLNTADQATLETLPDVGPVTAAAILEFRNQIGSFQSVEQLLDVSGIGPATLETIRPHVTV